MPNELPEHHSRLVVEPVLDPRLDEIDDQIAELVAEALFDWMMKNRLANKSKQSIMPIDEQKHGRTTHSSGSGGVPPSQSFYGVSNGGTR